MRARNFLAILLVGILIALLIFFGLNYVNWPAWTGFANRTWWDVMELLLVPLALSATALLFAQSQRRAENLREVERQRDAALQAYIDRLSSLLLDSDPTTPKAPIILNVARAQTLTVLRMLDGTRKGLVLQFLKDTQLINRDDPIVDLSNADASNAILHRTFQHQAQIASGSITVVEGVDLSNTDLSDVNFTKADLKNAKLESSIFVDAKFLEADLREANLRKANLYGALLIGAKMEGADLREADLSETLLHSANLSRADLTSADLRGAKLNLVDRKNPLMRAAVIADTKLAGAKYDAYTEWPPGFQPEQAGAVPVDHTNTARKSAKKKRAA
jgi:uncharacterized protein YjbI with pentapeptide repeats